MLTSVVWPSTYELCERELLEALPLEEESEVMVVGPGGSDYLGEVGTVSKRFPVFWRVQFHSRHAHRPQADLKATSLLVRTLPERSARLLAIAAGRRV